MVHVTTWSLTRLTVALATAIAVVCGALAVSAQGPAPHHAGTANPRDMSDYEWHLVQAALEARGLELLTDDQASGKTVEAIVVSTEEVFTAEDLYPNWANALHVVSHPDVIAREVLLEPGEPYVAELAAESARNLRGPQVLTVAQVLPVRGSTPGKVKILVVTKDLWSLRTNLNFLVVGDVIDFLSVSLTETNFLGLHKQAGLVGRLEQDTVSLGEFLVDRRAWGSRIGVSESAHVIFNRDSGKIEGFRGGLSVGQPLYSLRQRWGWSVTATGVTEIGRFFQGADLHVLDDPDTPEDEAMPFVWRTEGLDVDASVVRSFGLKFKRNLSLGYRLTYESYAYGDSDADRRRFEPHLVDLFERSFLPRSELVSAVYAQVDLFEARYLSLRNLETYALPEDFRFGPLLMARLSHADPAIGSNARFERLGTTAVYRWLLFEPPDGNPGRDGDVFSAALGYDTRIEGAELFDNEIQASLRNYSPVFAAGRLVVQSSLTYRFNDLSNATNTLGADSGLRGYPSALFFGASKVAGHVEWRTLPVAFYSFHLGGAAFYDAAGVSDRSDWSDLIVYHGAGLGLRLLNPVANRIVLRADWGIPLNPPPTMTVLPGEFTFGFEQAF